jgi:hypothetical protein
MAAECQNNKKLRLFGFGIPEQGFFGFGIPEKKSAGEYVECCYSHS